MFFRYWLVFLALKKLMEETTVIMLSKRCKRGVYIPFVIKNALQNITRDTGNKPNTSVFTDTTNNLRVITNSETGRVVTVIPGGG